MLLSGEWRRSMEFKDRSDLDARVNELLAQMRASDAQGGEASAEGEQTGACYIRSGPFTGCYPGVTYGQCWNLANSTKSAFAWLPGVGCNAEPRDDDGGELRWESASG
jgi:hypothetical protein